MIYVAAARQAYTLQEILDIWLVHSEHNAADAFTKLNRCLLLEALLCDRRMDYPVEEWVLPLSDHRSRDFKKSECRSTRRVELADAGREHGGTTNCAGS